MQITEKLIENYRDQIIHHSQELVKIKSVEDTSQPGMPFGEGINKALNYMLKLAEKMGFETTNVEGYAGHVDFGQGDDIVAVLVHLDVVPEGADWDYPPYGAEIHNGLLYGRGIIDDKGPAVASLFAMKALKDTGFVPDKKIRLIFGTDEESGWKDLEMYFKKHPKPEIGFSPDASFPLIHGEKGIQIVTLESQWKQNEGNVLIKSLKGGNAPNMVPDYAEAVLSMNEDFKIAVVESLRTYVSETGYRINVDQNDHDLVVTSKGISAHGSTPEKGINAIAQLLLFLRQCPGLGESAKTVLEDYKKYIGMELNGQSIGCGFEDEVSGKLIFNVGMVEGNEKHITLTINIRYPITVESELVIRGIDRVLQSSSMHLTLVDDVAPLYVPKEDELVKKLLQVYREETGDMTSEPITIGGGTYARALGRGVAFGPLLPDREALAHQKNEYMSVDDLVLVTRIYAKALQLLA